MSPILCQMIAALVATAPGGEVEPLTLTNAGAVSGVLHMQAGTWASIRAQVRNNADVAQEADLRLHLLAMPNVQFTGGVWVPPRSRRVVELPVRAPDKAMLDDAPDNPMADRAFPGKGVLIKSTPEGEVRLGIGDFLVMRRTDRPITTMIAGSSADDLSRRVVAALRNVSRLPPRTHFLRDRSLPTSVEEWQGVDALIMCTASPSISAVQLEALRRWVASGGRLWLMMDTITESFASRLLQDAWTCSIVDTVTLTDVCIRAHDGTDASAWPAVDTVVDVGRFRDADGLFGAVRMAVAEALTLDAETSGGIGPDTDLIETLGMSEGQWSALASRLAVHFHVPFNAAELAQRVTDSGAASMRALGRVVRGHIDRVSRDGDAIVAPDPLLELGAGGRVLLRHSNGLTHKNQNVIQSAIKKTKPKPLFLERSYETPVRMVRMVAPGWETIYTVKGWPAAVRRGYGHGWVQLTTLAAPGWIRQREDHDPMPSVRSLDREAITPAVDQAASGGGGADDAGKANQPQTRARSSYVARRALGPLGTWFNVSRVRELVPQRAYSRMAVQQVGYSIIGRNVILMVLGALVLGIAGVGLWLRTRGSLEYVAVVGAALAVVLAGALVVIGARHRHRIPLTLAKVEVVQISNDPDYAVVSGVLGTYAPEGGMGPLSASQGGLVWPDRKGQEAENLQLIWSDLGKWTWNNLRLPSGAMRDNAFHYVTSLDEPTTATLSFGAEGLEVTFAGGTFERFEDAMVVTTEGRLALRSRDGGTMAASESDRLHFGEFIKGSRGLTTEVQQRRAVFYASIVPNLFDRSKHFARTPRGRHPSVPRVLGYASSIDTGFTLPKEQVFETRDETLLVVPARWQRPAPGSPVTVPSPLVKIKAMRGGMSLYNPMGRWAKGKETGEFEEANPWMSMPSGGRAPLRFTVPEVLVPWRVAQARLVIKLRAPGRTLTVRCLDGDTPEPVYTARDPSGTVEVDLPAAALDALGRRGETVLEIQISNVAGATAGPIMQSWDLDDVTLHLDGEVVEAF